MPHTIGGLDRRTGEALAEIGEAVRYLRSQEGMSQRVLAERCGLSQSTISRLENGLAPGLRIAWLARLLVGLHREAGPPGARHWEVWTPPTWTVLIERFARTGNLARRMHDAETERALSISRLMHLEASREEEPLDAEHETEG